MHPLGPSIQFHNFYLSICSFFVIVERIGITVFRSLKHTHSLSKVEKVRVQAKLSYMIIRNRCGYCYTVCCFTRRKTLNKGIFLYILFYCHGGFFLLQVIRCYWAWCRCGCWCSYTFGCK